MFDEMSTVEFRVRFPEPSCSAARVHFAMRMQVYRLLWLTAGVLPEDCGQLRGLIATVLDEVYRGNDTGLLRRIGIQLLGLAYPAIDERQPETRDQIERFFAEAGSHGQFEDIPY